MDILDIFPVFELLPYKSGKLVPVAINVKYCNPFVLLANLAAEGTPLDVENPISPVPE